MPFYTNPKYKSNNNTSNLNRAQGFEERPPTLKFEGDSQNTQNFHSTALIKPLAFLELQNPTTIGKIISTRLKSNAVSFLMNRNPYDDISFQPQCPKLYNTTQVVHITKQAASYPTKLYIILKQPDGLADLSHYFTSSH